MIRDTYYPDLSAFSKPKTESLRLTELFEGMGTLVPFGWAKSTEAIGGIATPDTNVALISRVLGPVGDNRQSIENYKKYASTGEKDFSKGTTLFPAVSANDYSGLINIGVEQLLGKNAEILPGILFSDCLDFIMSYGEGAQTLRDPRAVRPLEDTPKRKTGLQWNVEIVGAEWLFNLISLGASDPGAQLILDALTSESQAGTEIPEPIELGIEASLDWSTSDFKSYENSVFSFINKALGQNSRFEIGAGH